MKGEKCPPGFHQKGKKAAKHWLMLENVKTGWGGVAPKPSLVIACGQEMDAGAWRDRGTKDSLAVTCWDCARVAQKEGFNTKLPAKSEMF